MGTMNSLTGEKGRYRVMANGLAALVLGIGLAGCSSTATNDTFDLTGVASANGPAKRARQLLVPEPTALKALDSDSVLVRVSGTEIQYLSYAQWSDRLPEDRFASERGGYGRLAEHLAPRPITLTESIAVTYHDFRWAMFVMVATRLVWPDEKIGP